MSTTAAETKPSSSSPNEGEHTSAIGINASTGAGNGEAQQGPPNVSAEVLAEFRQAFSHLEREGDSICGWLTEAQQLALARLLEARGLKPKEPWSPAQLWDATQAEVQQIEAFRRQLETEGHLADEHAKAYCGDLTLLRYLRARDHNISASHHMLLNSLTWRAQHKPWLMENTSSRTNKMSSDARIVGLDPQGRVVVYSSFSHTKERQPDKVTLNTVVMMEKACQCMAGSTPAQVLWVNHFCGKHKRGFSWGDANPRFAFAGLTVFMDNFPECLKTMVIVDPPSIFFTVWKLIRPLLPIKTQQKGEFVDSASAATRERFTELFGAELGDYLMDLVHKDNKVA